MSARRGPSLRSKIALGALFIALALASVGALVVERGAEQLIRDAESTLANQDLDALERQITGTPGPTETAVPEPPPTEHGGRHLGIAGHLEKRDPDLASEAAVKRAIDRQLELLRAGWQGDALGRPVPAPGG